MIRPYADLTSEESEALFSYLLSCGMALHVDDRGEMHNLYASEVFDKGQSHFTLFEDGKVTGALGVVTREIACRGEVFITGVYVHHEHAWNVARLLARGFSYLTRLPATKSVKLGLYRGGDHLLPYLREQGFSPRYGLQTMRQVSQGRAVVARDDIDLIPLCGENAEDFRSLCNAAFASSPNGGTLSPAQMQELLTSESHAGLCVLGGEIVGAYRLRLDGPLAWIEDVAVCPRQQGQGVGTRLVARLMSYLSVRGVNEIQLTVASSNERAVKLYQKAGFEFVSTDSVWMELE